MQIALAVVLATAPAVAAQGCPSPSTGPDVYVGEITTVSLLGEAGGVAAYSLGTTACNGGDVQIAWQASSTQHPVLAFQLYRLEDGRFEQLGLSWVRHAVFALQSAACCPCTPAPGGAALGVGCSSTNGVGVNANQALLGPRSEVDPTTGTFAFPYGDPGLPDTTTHKRLQVASAELDPALHPTARFFVEAQYVAPDDAAAGNRADNVSFREVLVAPAPSGAWNLNVTGPTTTKASALEAWPTLDPLAAVVEVQVPGDGTFFVGDRVSDNGDGTWHYEFVVHDRDASVAAGGFRVPVPSGVTVTNVGFHDVAHHSGEPFDGTDWPGAHVGDEVVWSTTPFAVDPDANAVRWGTGYAFRFDADAPPTVGTATLELFRPHVPSALPVPLRVPACGGLTATETIRLGTPPNPAALLPGVTSRPRIGATWDPVVDHGSFYPDALFDLLAIQPDGAAVELPTALGTVLCNVPGPGGVHLVPASLPFAIPIPDDCGLVGRSVCTQGGALGGSLGIRLANALDLVLGDL